MHQKRRMNRALIILIPLVVLIMSACTVKLTPQFSHQGQLLDDSGNPVPDGNYEVAYEIYNVVSDGTAVYTETQSIPVENGLFTTSLGLTGAITPTIFAEPAWLQITVEGETLTPRQRLQGAPYAFSLISGAVVQGTETIARDFVGQTDTGAALTVLNVDASATGGHGLLAINQAAAAGADKDKVAALQARAIGGVQADGTGAYGAIITSQAYRGMYAKGHDSFYAAVFDSPVGIQVTGGGGCVGCTLYYTALNVGDAPIRAGDFVAVDGVEMDTDFNIPVMQVRRATGPSDNVIGVATASLVRAPMDEFQGVRTGGYNVAGQTAAAGEFVSVAVQGLVQARAANGANLSPGVAVSVATDGVVASTGSGVARAMSALDGNGMVWVMLGSGGQ